jgi:hypothetical protein
LDVDPDADSLHELISRPALTNALYGQALTVYLDTHGHADLVPDLLGNDKCFCAECVQRRILQAFEGWWRARMRHGEGATRTPPDCSLTSGAWISSRPRAAIAGLPVRCPTHVLAITADVGLLPAAMGAAALRRTNSATHAASITSVTR